MDHAITVGEVLGFLLAIGAIFGIGALLVFLLWLFNPFRTGH